MKLKQHPLSAAFPSMPDAEFVALTNDIRAHGQREPAIVLDGMVLDGWHRVRACDVIGIEPDVREFYGDDPAAFVLSKNLHRRHLDASQRALAVAACSEWAHVGSNQHATAGSAPGADPQAEAPGGSAPGAEAHGGGSAPGAEALTNKQMARAADVSERTMHQAKVVVTKAVPEVQEKVKSGELSVKAAADIAQLPPEEQVKALHAPKLRPLPAPKLEPAPAPALQPVEDHGVDDTDHQAELLRHYEELLAENNEMLKVFEADDKLKAAWEENKKLRHENDGLRRVIATLQNEKNEAIRLAKARLNKLKKAGLE